MHDPRLARDSDCISDLWLLCDGVILRSPTDDDAQTLARLAATPGAVLSDAEKNYVTWLEDPPVQIAEDLIRNISAHRQVPRLGPWTLDFTVVVDEQVLGLQSLSGFDRWPRRRNVGTSSWIVAVAQGRGYGTRARVAVLDLAFDILGAEAALSWTLPSNDRSRRVSERLGYDLIEPARNPTEESKYRLRAELWPPRRPTVLPPTLMQNISVLRPRHTG